MDKPKKQKAQSNADIEMRWVEAWNNLFDIVEQNSDMSCLLPDGVVVDVEGGKAWLQDSVYEGYHVIVERGRVLGRPGAILLRSI